MGRWFAVVLAGCGRIGFDATGDATAGGDGAVPLVEHLPCETRVLLDSGNDLPQDGLAWITEPQGDWLIVSRHVACDMHPIERYTLDLGATGITAGDTGAMFQTGHAHNVSLEPTASGYVMGYLEVLDNTVHTAKVGTDMTVATSQSLGMLAAGNPPLARSGGGGLAVIGVQSSTLVAIPVDDSGAATSTPATLALPAEGPDQPTMVATDTGLVAAWRSSVTGHCRVAVLNPDLTIAAGPVNMAVAGCSAPQVAWLASARRIVVVAQDANPDLYAAVWTDTLSPAVAPFRVATRATGPRVVADASTAWVVWADSSTFALGHARLDASGAVTMHAPVGQVDSTLPHYESLVLVAGDPVALWLDAAQNRSLAAMRFCP